MCFHNSISKKSQEIAAWYGKKSALLKFVSYQELILIKVQTAFFIIKIQSQFVICYRVYSIIQRKFNSLFCFQPGFGIDPRLPDRSQKSPVDRNQGILLTGEFFNDIESSISIP